MNWISRNIYMYVLEHTHTNKEIKQQQKKSTTTTRINCVVRVQAIQLAINNNYSEKKNKKQKNGIHVNLG